MSARGTNRGNVAQRTGIERKGGSSTTWGTCVSMIIAQQARLPQQPLNGLTHLCKGRLDKRRARHQDQLAARPECRETRAHGFAQQAPRPVPSHCVADSAAGCHTDVNRRRFTRGHEKNNKRVGIRPGLAPHPLEFARATEAIPSLHPYQSGRAGPLCAPSSP